ncbi:MAG: choice-of-anchor L domain-containing protein [Flavobacteriales bacterium]|nr:choice-of-anchor L domain-containing protein [Flavobacteriales bacterium]
MGFIVIFLFVAVLSNAQMIVAGGFGGQVLVNNILVGDGVKTKNIVYQGHSKSIALFERGDSADLGLDAGIILSSGIATDAKGPNDVPDKSGDMSQPGNITLDNIAKIATKDAAVLEFEFMPQTEEIEFKYIFASEEYPRYVDRGFNDVFGFFISGPGISGEQNVALVPGSNVEVTIDNVNHLRNTEYFILNDSSQKVKQKYLQPNGQTVVLKANLTLIPCNWYKIKLGIADVGDRNLDSWVFVGSKSFKHKTGLGNDTTFCSENFNITLDAGHPDRNVLWYPSGERTQKINVKSYGTYTVEVFTQCGSFKDVKKILPAIKPIDIGNDTTICGNEIAKNLEVKARTFDTYQWSNGDTTPTIFVDKPGTYWLKVGRYGCYEEDTITIDAIAIPEVHLGNDTTFCGDFILPLKSNFNGDDYTWNDGSKLGILRATTPGLYWLRVDKDICHDIDTIVLNQRKPFSIDIGDPYQVYCQKRDIRLSTQLNDSSYSFSWNTGDSVGAITVNETGRYKVVVTDKVCGYSDFDETEIVFLAENLDYFVPNAFSPNNDGLNESIGPVFPLSKVDEYSFEVYNLWGEKIFESFVYGEKWDGTYKGKQSEPGVYIWMARIKAECLQDPKMYKWGTVTLMR